jgi:hypothetical protein
MADHHRHGPPRSFSFAGHRFDRHHGPMHMAGFRGRGHHGPHGDSVKDRGKDGDHRREDVPRHRSRDGNRDDDRKKDRDDD